MKRTAVALAALLVLSAPAAATLAAPPESAGSPQAEPTTPTPQEQAVIARLQALDRALTRRTGVIPLPTAKVTLNLGEAYYFLDAADAKKVIVDGWGNPPGSADDVLGMVVLADKSPFDDIWSAVISYTADGYVADADAKDIKPDDLLKTLREGEPDSNRARREAGYPESHLAGWAQPPSYDAATHTLIWAQDIAFTGAEAHTLNYDVRILGREGVLSVNMVAGMKDLADVRTAAQSLQRVVTFNAGSRYADYKQGDRKAEYGVAGLLAAGLGLAAAKKAGLLGALLLFGKKFGVFIIAGLAGVGAWIRRMMAGGGRE